jgi:hypothetical protein
VKSQNHSYAQHFRAKLRLIAHEITGGSHPATINMVYGDHTFGRSSHIQGGRVMEIRFSISLNLFKLKAILPDTHGANYPKMTQTKKNKLPYHSCCTRLSAVVTTQPVESIPHVVR